MIAIRDATRDLRLADILTRLSAGSGPGTVKLYGGTQPAAGEPAGAAPLLATFTLAEPAGTISAHRLTLAFAAQFVTAAASGAPTWGRAADSAGEWVFDGDAGGAGSGALFEVAPATFTLGGIVAVASATIDD